MTNMEKLKRAASAKPEAKAGLTCLVHRAREVRPMTEAEALREILRLLTGNAELPEPELIHGPQRIVDLLQARLRVLEGAETTLPGLAEICVTLAERGDRWKAAAEAHSLVRMKAVEAAMEHPAGEQLAERVQMGFAETLRGASNGL